MEWKITQLDYKPLEAGQSNVVASVHWECSKLLTQDDKTYFGRFYGSTGIAHNEGDEFIPFDQLTKQQVLDWIWASGVNKDEIEAGVQRQIDAQINPPVISFTPSWG